MVETGKDIGSYRIKLSIPEIPAGKLKHAHVGLIGKGLDTGKAFIGPNAPTDAKRLYDKMDSVTAIERLILPNGGITDRF